MFLSYHKEIVAFSVENHPFNAIYVQNRSLFWETSKPINSHFGLNSELLGVEGGDGDEVATVT
jgi:hypothetical protein